MLTSIVIDHFGLFGYAIKPIDLLRSLGVILMGLGNFINQLLKIFLGNKNEWKNIFSTYGR